MAFGIDDALMTAAAAISVSNTLVEVVAAYRRRNSNKDVQSLLDEVTMTARQGLDQADRALRDFEEDLKYRGVDISKSLNDVVRSTPMWNPFEWIRLRRYRAAFTALSNAAYDSSDSVGALARCRDEIGPVGEAVAASAPEKHKFHRAVLDSSSVSAAIGILRGELLRQKQLLG